MRLTTFIFGIVSVFLVAAVGYWVFVTMQFPAGPVNVLVVRTGQPWIPQVVMWWMAASLVLAVVGSFMSWRPRVARMAFAVSGICWAVVAVAVAVGMGMKMGDPATAPPGADTVSLLLNVVLDFSPLLPLVAAHYVAGIAARRRADKLSAAS